MGLQGVKALVAAEDDGQFWFTTWRKQATQTTGAGIWFDLSMSPGNPVPNYYAASPGIAVALAQSTNGGIPHGGAVSPAKKYLKQFMAMTTTAAAVPLNMTICDYIIYYPFVDMSITDPQPMDNTVTLPRHASGVGVQMMAVEVAGQSGVGNPQFFINYTNSDSVAQQTHLISCNTQVVNGTIINTSTATAGCVGSPFIPLLPGDKGVKTIDSVTFLSADIGLIAFVLVYPQFNHTIRTIDAPVERNVVVDFMAMRPIEDDAYLNIICCPNGTLAAAPIHGTAHFVWGGS